MRKFIFLTALASLALAACASMDHKTDAQRFALYDAHAGAPVRNIAYFNPLGWDKVDDQHLLLTMRPTEVYLLRVSGPCLRWSGSSPTIQISTLVGRLSSGFDRIHTPNTPVSCRIEEIRPVNVSAVRESQREMAAQ